VCLLALAGPAQGLVVSRGARQFGITPLAGSGAGAGLAASRGAAGLDTAGQLSYHGGPVMHSVGTHVIYWDPSGEFTEEAKEVVHGFLAAVAHDSGSPTNVFAVGGQYTDSKGNAAYVSSLEGEAVDSESYPASGCTPKGGDKGPPYTRCLTDEQLQEQLSSYIAAHKLPTGLGQLYLLLLPHKVASCFEAAGEICSNNYFCAYHSYVSGGSQAKDVVYADIAWSLLDSGNAKSCQFDGNEAIQHPNGDTAGTNATTRYADVALKYLSHEYVEAVTDPLLNAWTDPKGEEIGDKCNYWSAKANSEGGDPKAFSPTLGGEAGAGTLYDQQIDAGSYYLQSEWDNAAEACRMKPVALSGAAFSASPEEAQAGSAVSFKASVSDIYGEPRYAWKFGDGSEASGESPSHSYSTPGTYTVTMTPTDALTGSTSASVHRSVTVSDEAPSASFTISPSAAATHATVSFSAEASDPDGTISSYVWHFGDGGEAEGASAAHAYSSPGTYEVTLRVTDSGGQSTTVAHSLTVGAQSISFTSQPPSPALVGAAPYTVAATASSGLAVSFSSATPAVCAVNGASVTFLAAGSCTIDANQSGSAEYSPAPQAQQSFSVAAAAPASPASQAGAPSAATVALIDPAPAAGLASLGAGFGPQPGEIVFSPSLTGAGRLSWLLTFPDGTYGVFAAHAAHCRPGYARVKGRCRRARVVYARGSRAVAAAGKPVIAIAPTRAGLKALRAAAKRHRALRVTATLTFRPALGGLPVTVTRTLAVKLRRR
jgi:PKD repeat protein